jgi:hypothetical protein
VTDVGDGLTFDPRPRSAVQGRLVLLLAVLFVIVFVIVFVPPLRARFVSDSFVLFENARRQTPVDVLAGYLPAPGRWYRPTTDLVFWLEAHVFGDEPIGYHLLTLVCHLVSAVLLYGLTVHLTKRRAAGVVAFVAFALLPAAHEPLWDIADLHTALSGPLLLATLLAYARGHRRLALAAALVALTVDEVGLVGIGLICLYILLIDGRPFDRFSMRRALLPAAPFLALGIGYVAIRVLAGPIFSEGIEPCRSPQCLAVAGAEYVNRLVVRPDGLLQLIWLKRPQFAVLSVAILLLALLAGRVWRPLLLQPVFFATGWILGASAFFILTLWSYVPDRFFYIPDMGLCLLLGTIFAGASLEWAHAGRGQRMALLGGAAFLSVWLALGVPMMVARGQAWVEGGDQAARVVDAIKHALPDPPAGAVISVTGAPDAVLPQIPPGNSGAWVFHNGVSLERALQSAYRRVDLTVTGPEQTADPARPNVPFVVRDGIVVPVP